MARLSNLLDNSYVGYTGSQGLEGNNAGLRYNFSTTTTDADPGTGVFRYNNATIGSVTQIFIDVLNVSSVDFTSYIDTWDDSTNVVKGYIIIDSNTNSDTTKSIFQLNSITTATGYRKLNVTYISGSLPANNEACVIQFYRAGNLGFTGSQGTAGFTGSVGFVGSRGATGFTGSKGDIGFTGSAGGATGGSTDKVFYENDRTITSNYTITAGKNAMTAGPITISDGVVVTVPDGSVWTVV